MAIAERYSEPSARPSGPSLTRAATVARRGMIAVALIVAWILLDGREGLRTSQTLLLVLGAVVVAWGSLGSRPAWQRRLSIASVVVVATSVALVLAEVMLTFFAGVERKERPFEVVLQGMYERGERTSYRMVSGFEGTYDDDVVQADITINSRGDRDDEPDPSVAPQSRVLLMGDSFTFGFVLSADQAIDRWMERLSDGRVDAYNLGVPGYGTGNVVRRMSESSWWTGKTVYYLFFANDLQDGNVDPDLVTVHDGFVVPRFDSDGSRLDEEAWDERIAGVRAHYSDPLRELRSIMQLTHLRGMAQQVMDRDLRLTGLPPGTIHEQNLDIAAEHSRQMQQDAHARGATFAVVILPAKGEAIADEYSSWTRAYIDRLQADGIDVLEPIGPLGREHYFEHDSHFDPEGAQLVAQWILSHFEEQ